MLLLLWRAWWLNTIAAVTQAAAVVSATLTETFNVTAAVTQAAATASATEREIFNVAVAVSQAKAVASSTQRELFNLAITITQAAAVASATGLERFNFAVSGSQAVASPHASIAVVNPAGAVPVTSSGGGGSRRQTTWWFPTVWPSDRKQHIALTIAVSQQCATVDARGTVRRKHVAVAACRQSTAAMRSLIDVVDNVAEAEEEGLVLGNIDDGALALLAA